MMTNWIWSQLWPYKTSGWDRGLDMAWPKRSIKPVQVAWTGSAAEQCSWREFHVTASGVGFFGLSHVERTYTTVNKRFGYEPWVVNDWLIGGIESTFSHILWGKSMTRIPSQQIDHCYVVTWMLFKHWVLRGRLDKSASINKRSILGRNSLTTKHGCDQWKARADQTSV